MYPFFYFWFKGNNIKEIMSFKSNVFGMTKEEFADFYTRRDSLAKDRPTDLSEESINFMLGKLDKSYGSLLDVGCGNGYFLNRVKDLIPDTCGCDVFDNVHLDGGKYVQADIENLPFDDNEFDVVCCHHVLEHVLDLPKAVAELKRVAAKKLIVVVPCQRYYYYTLDEHIRFFPYKELLEHAIRLTDYHCEKIRGDLVYIGHL